MMVQGQKTSKEETQLEFPSWIKGRRTVSSPTVGMTLSRGNIFNVVIQVASTCFM